MAKVLDAVGVLLQLKDSIQLAGGRKYWCRLHGISQSYVSDLFSGKRGLGDKVLVALGMKSVILYVTKDDLYENVNALDI